MMLQQPLFVSDLTDLTALFQFRGTTSQITTGFSQENAIVEEVLFLLRQHFLTYLSNTAASSFGIEDDRYQNTSAEEGFSNKNILPGTFFYISEHSATTHKSNPFAKEVAE